MRQYVHDPPLSTGSHEGIIMKVSSLLRCAAMVVVVSALAADAVDASCIQADASRARRAQIDSMFSVTGAGSTQKADGSTILVWTGTDCIAWIRFRGPVSVGTDWQSLVASAGSEFHAHDEGPEGRRDVIIDANGQRTFTHDGKVVAATPALESWTASMVREYVRRSGTGAATRANEIVARQGIAGLLAEAREIAIGRVRVRYLFAGFARVDASARAAFIQSAADLLDESNHRAEFLLATPPAWRADDDVIAAVYSAATALDADDAVEQLLRTMPPPRPAPPALRPAMETIFRGLQNSERRAALRAYYLDVRP
jgi:hypothetical protein